MDVGTAVASAWASGISMYFVAAVLGVAGRLDWVDTPTFLEQPWVIAVAVLLFATEFVVDKISWLDSTWDAVHTALRPAAGAYLLGTSGGDTQPVVLVVSGALLALSAHSAKASTRALVNTSPEPASNVVVSLFEDGLVAGLMALAIAYPTAAAAVTLVLAVFSVLFTFVLVRTTRRFLRRRRERRAARRAGQARTQAE